MEIIKKTVEYKTKQVVFNDKNEIVEIKDVTKTCEFEVGLVAKQADASVRVTSGGTSVLCCVVVSKKENKGINVEDVTPLTVDYRERTYAAGKIPGGFFKREGRPREHEIHISRLIDRTLRPLFPKGVNRDIQINALVLSFEPENDPAVLSVLGCSCALMLSSIPFNGPCSCLRLCKIDNQYIINPTYQEREFTYLDLTVSFHKDKVLMIEFEGKEKKENEIIGSIKQLQTFIDRFNNLQEELVKECGKEKFKIEKKVDVEKIVETNFNNLSKKILDVLKISEKQDRENEYSNLISTVEIPKNQLPKEIAESEELIDKLKEKIFFLIMKDVVRNEIIKTKVRPDGRSFEQLREIKCDIGVLPRTHGSALFQRGQTQALVAVTLGTASDMQIMDELVGEYKERFLFHYNFPGFATGEVRPDRGVSRREQGHGLLAKKALQPIIPTEDEFPYAIRIVSDILESNGSSSMASVCGGSLALFDAGVKLKTAVAGVALGLIYSDDKYIILTDISGIEDHIGDMDFKIAGTKDGITAIQLDLKIDGIPLDVVSESLKKGAEARKNILEIMNKSISAPRNKVSQFAPKLKLVQIPTEKIGELIGPGGRNIKQIIEQTQSKIDVDPTGKVFISAETDESLDSAVERIEWLTKELEVGKIYKGKVAKIVEYGAFIEFKSGKSGLLHISRIAEQRIKDVESVLKEGEEIYVKVIEIDSEGRPVLSRKDAIKEGFK